MKAKTVIRSREGFLAAIVLFVIVFGLSFSTVSIKAQADPKTVHVVICIDSEMGGGHDPYIGSSQPHPTMDMSAYSRTSPSTVAAVFDADFRNSRRDSFGNTFKITWFAEMDYLMAQSNFVWGDGSPAGVSGYTAIRDILVNNWGTEIQRYGDSIEYHHHFMIYDGTWQRYDNGPDEGYPECEMYALDHMILDRNFYPSTFRSGWLVTSPALSTWLEQWMPFDFTPSDREGYPVNPSGMDRWQTLCSGGPSQSEVNKAFARARDYGSALYSFYCHNRDDMAGLIDSVQSYLTTAASNPAYAGVLFKWDTAREAMQQVLGFSDSTQPTFTVTSSGGTYTITSSEPLWQNQPYVALKYADGTYVHAEATAAGTNAWTISPPNQIVTQENVAVRARATTGISVAAATASSYRPSYEPYRAIDGDDSTGSFWDSTPGKVPAWLKLDLGSVKTFSNIRTHFWDGDGRYYKYYVDVSNDDLSWTRVVGEKVGESVMWDYFNPAISARYIRITVTYNSANPYAHIIEVNVGIDPASVTASSYDGNQTPDLAVDGIESTSNYWGTNPQILEGQVPQWLNIDLRSSVSISKINTHFYDGDGRTYTYYIEASTDNSSWMTIVPLKTGKGSVTDTFPETTARYVRITVTSNTANKGAHIEEIKIYHETTLSLPQLEKIGVAASDLYGNTGVFVADAIEARSYLTLTTSPVGVTTPVGQGWYDTGTYVSISTSQYVYAASDTRYRFNGWITNDMTKITDPTSPSTTLLLDINKTVTANYVLQHQVTFSQTGLDASATGMVVAVDGSTKAYADLPFSKWIDSGSSVSYSYMSEVSGSGGDKQFKLSSVAGPTSPFTVTGPTTVTGNYVVQYQVTFTHMGLDSSASGTVVTVNGGAKSYGDLPYTLWVDNGLLITYSYNSPVSSRVGGKQFKLTSVSGPASTITVANSATVTGNYAIQYLMTFAQTGLDSTTTGTVVTANGTAKAYNDLSYGWWVDSGSTVTYSYSDPVLSTVAGKQFKQTGISGPASPITVASSVTVTGNYKIQYQITFDQTGVGADFTGTIVTMESSNYNYYGLSVQFWWDKESNHTFSFASPLTVNASKQYVWSSTSGLTSAQNGILTVTGSGSVVGNYVMLNCVTFDQLGVGGDFGGTILTVDSVPYTALPQSFMWQLGSVHNFSFQSPLVVTASSKQCVWANTTGSSNVQSGSITVTAFGSIIGHYKTQYYLDVATSPPGITTPSGSNWYDAGTYASISTDQYVYGGSRWKFVGWTTADMSEIADASSPSTTVFVDKAKTVTANYVHQYLITFYQSGLASDASGTVVTVNGTAKAYGQFPYAFWVDEGCTLIYSYETTVSSTLSGKQFRLDSVTGPSSPITVSADTNVTGNYVPQYYLTVSSPYSTIGGQGWYDSGGTAYASLGSGVVDHGNGTKRVFTNWNGDASGTNYAQSNPITMDGAKTAVAVWKTQYRVTFDQLGLDSTASGSVVTVNSISKAYGDLPYTIWVDDGGSATYSYGNVSSLTAGKRFILTGVTGPSSPIPVNAPVTVIGNYKIQYQITFSQTGVGSDFAGTVVTIEGVNYTVSSLPSASFWWETGSVHAFAYQSPLVVTSNGKRYVWVSTSGLSSSQNGVITVSGSGNVIGNYKTQYYLRISSTIGGTTNPVSGNYTYDEGTNVTVTAYPSAGYEFSCWVFDGVNITQNQIEITMNIGHRLDAIFNQIPQPPPNWAINITSQPPLGGATDPSGIQNISYDSSLSVTAIPNDGYIFKSWIFDGIDYANSTTIVVLPQPPGSIHTLIAVFEVTPPPPSTEGKDVFVINTNSTLSELNFNSKDGVLSFKVSGPSGTKGYVNASLATTILPNPDQLKVYLDGIENNYTMTLTQDYCNIYFEYHHSEHYIKIMLLQHQSEIPIEQLIALALIATLGVLSSLLLKDIMKLQAGGVKEKLPKSRALRAWYCHGPLRAIYDLKLYLMKDLKVLGKIFFMSHHAVLEILDKTALMRIHKIITNSHVTRARMWQLLLR